jgi:hypothetical protein
MTYSAQNKWGDAALVGFSQVPDTLLKAQHAIGISPLELNVLLNLISFWWKADDQPYPSSAAIAKRMGVQPRTVQKTIKVLVDRGIIGRTPISGKGAGRSKYDLQPLVRSVGSLARRDPRFLKLVRDDHEAA